MGIADELRDAGVVVVSKGNSRMMKLIGFFLGKWFMDSAWSTISARRIYAPIGTRLDRLDIYALVVKHELVHIAQAKRLWWFWQLSYLLFPLPIGLAWFRWRWEREAYLVQLRAGASPSDLADLLWSHYGWPWPRAWMRRWFERQRTQA